MAPSLPSLLSRTTLDDHEEILKAANEALKKSKSDINVQHARAIALLKLDRFDDALKTFEEGGAALQEAAQLEYAYALYKNGKYDEAEKIASTGPARRSLKYVESQASYLQENFVRARQLYTELASQRGALAGEDNDLTINSGATDAQLCWSGQSHLAKKMKAAREDMEQFESAFNAACGYIARGELKQASTLLSRAKNLCELAEELSDADKEAELLPITVQQIYVLTRLGHTEEAEKLASTIRIDQITDLATRHIAQNNAILVSNQEQNPFLAHRLLQSSAKLPKVDKLFKYQNSTLIRNALTLDLLAGKKPKVRSKRNDVESALSPDMVSEGVFRAAAQARSQSGKSGLREVLPLLERNPKDLGIVITAVQLYTLSNNTHMAGTLLEKYFGQLEESSSPEDLSIRFAPGLVALQASLNTHLNRSLHGKAELVKAARYWQDNAKAANNLSPLFTAAGIAILDNATSQDREAAHDLFTFLSKHSKEDAAAIAGLAASSASYDDTLAAKLSPLDKFISGIDAAALELAGTAKPVPHQPATSRKRPATDVQPKATAPKKIRKSKMPKDYDPNKKMDPERWLPQRDRAGWRPKGKKKGRVAGMSTQGGIVSEDSRPATPSQTIQAKPTAGQNKKKKGKK